MSEQQLDLSNKEGRKVAAVRKILGEPVFISLSNYVLNLRRNLVALSIAIIAYKWMNIKVNSLFGLDCTGVEPHKIDIALAVYLSYSALHFFSEVCETYGRWKIRLSGTFVEVQREPLNPPTSTSAMEVRSKRDEIQDCIGLRDIGYCHGEQSYLYSIMAQAVYYNSKNITGETKLGDMRMSSSDLSGDNQESFAGEAILEIVKTGLERFNKGFRNFQIVQLIRFLFWDILIPLGITIIAFYMLYSHLNEQISFSKLI